MKSEDSRKIMNVLFVAMNDWPIPITKLEDYESEVSRFIGGVTTKENINEALSAIDFSKHSWQAESLAQLIYVFEFYDNGTSLREIIVDVQKVNL